MNADDLRDALNDAANWLFSSSRQPDLIDISAERYAVLREVGVIDENGMIHFEKWKELLDKKK